MSRYPGRYICPHLPKMLVSCNLSPAFSPSRKGTPFARSIANSTLHSQHENARLECLYKSANFVPISNPLRIAKCRNGTNETPIKHSAGIGRTGSRHSHTCATKASSRWVGLCSLLCPNCLETRDVPKPNSTPQSHLARISSFCK